MFKKIIKNESGQSLIEIIIALSIGAILIGAASTAIITVLNSNSSSEIQRQSTVMTQDMVERIRSYADANWNNLNSLDKGFDNSYYFTVSSTDIVTIKGKEGVISGDIRRGLVGHWKMDETEGNTAYDYAESNNGIISGAVTTSTDSCVVGGCLDFDGTDDYVTLGNVDSIKNNSVGTISLWVNPQKTDLSFALGWHGNTSNYMRLEIRGDSYVRWLTEVGNVGNSFSSEAISPIGQWTHITIKQDGINVRMFINGKLQTDTGNDTWFGTHPTLNLFFAHELSWNGYMYEGKIDDVRIYDRALADSEVRTIYNSAVFRRYFYVEEACRTNDANYSVDGAVPCDSGSAQDPDTLRITSTVEWDASSSVQSFELVDYVTRWRNEVYRQTDWSGGGGDDGPFTESTDKYSTSTDIEIGTGSFQLEFPD
ncbi:MAG: LamG-like jellyroll fold domain-containing protein [Candidatus Paceibacterota bacterium]